MWPFNLSVRLPIVDLVGRYLTNYLIGRELTPNRFAPFTSAPCDTVVSCGISTCFQVLSPCLGQIAHALLTRPPLEYNLPGRSPSNHIPVRLACVKHAASVRPEPGSNSDVQSFSTPFRSRSLPLRLAKASGFLSVRFRSWCFSLRILTVAILPRRSPFPDLRISVGCLFSLLCIVFKVRAAPLACPNGPRSLTA